MLLVMPFMGRMTERHGGGRVALVGVSILCLGTIPLAFVGAGTSIHEISLVLLLRGVGGDPGRGRPTAWRRTSALDRQARGSVRRRLLVVARNLPVGADPLPGAA